MAVVVIAVLAAGIAWFFLRPKSPVPSKIAKAVDFPVYYPDPKKLPAGYTLDTTSFKNPVSNGISYSVDYGNGQKLVFSLQDKPSSSELQDFNSNYIPLHNDYKTPVGQAELGAYNNHGTTESLISLPTNGKTWIIITAPYNTDQTKLKQVLSALRN